MYRYNGRVLKTLRLPGDGWVDIVARADGTFRYYERVPESDLSPPTVQFESGSYVTAETAEAAARQKFRL